MNGAYLHNRYTSSGRGGPALTVAAIAAGVLSCSFSWAFFLPDYVLVLPALGAALGLAGIVFTRQDGESVTLPVVGLVLSVLSVASFFGVRYVVHEYVTDRLGSISEGFASNFSDVELPGVVSPDESDSGSLAFGSASFVRSAVESFHEETGEWPTSISEIPPLDPEIGMYLYSGVENEFCFTLVHAVDGSVAYYGSTSGLIADPCS